MTTEQYQNLIEITADIVSAFVGNNAVRSTELPDLIHAVYTSLQGIGKPKADQEHAPVLTPAVWIKKSVTDDYIICLDNGKKFKSLRRHLQSAFGMTPEEYRAKWGLPRDYPMVAPGYAAKRSELAKLSGLGNLGRGARVVAVPVAAPPSEPGHSSEPVKRAASVTAAKPSSEVAAEPAVDAPAKRRGRPKKAA